MAHPPSVIATAADPRAPSHRRHAARHASEKQKFNRPDKEHTMKMDPVIYPVKDLDSAKQLFRTLLGAEPYADQPYYVGFRVEGQEFGLNPHGHAQGMTGPVGFFAVDDIRSSLASVLGQGAQLQQDVQDVGGGKLTAVVTDADGNPIGLIQSP
jgi:predicted enzyme related to lactoylglutathione lyase